MDSELHVRLILGRGHGAFIAMVGLCWYGYFQYENGYLRRTERDERPQRKQHYI